MSYTKLKNLLAAACCLVALLLPVHCLADHITLTASTHSDIVVDTQQVIVKFLISNEGDEAAINPAIEFPSLKRQFSLANSIAPGESISHTVEMTFEDFGIDLPGRYVMPFRLAYEDSNLFPFSSPSAVVLVYQLEPPRRLTMGFSGVSGALRLELEDSSRAVLEILNSSEDVVKIEQIVGHTATELQLTVNPPQLPLELKPGEKTSVAVTMQRTVGQIQGSTYGGQLIVSGSAAGAHFVESASFVAKIIGEPVQSHQASRIALLALAAIVVLGWFFQRKAGS